MLTGAAIQQGPKPKRRIGRARFLLEFFIAAALIKVGTSGFGVVFAVVPAVGFLLAIWASVRRLRDIKRSEWWVLIWIAILPFGFVLGFTGMDVTSNAYVKAFGIAYFVVYVLWLGVLIFWPSAFPKHAVAKTEKQLSTEQKEPITDLSGPSGEDAMRVGRQYVPRMNRFNGWQRIGVVLSALWCLGVIAKTCYDSYEAASFNAYVASCCEEDKTRPPKKERNAGDFISYCEAADVCARATMRPTLPPLQPFLALLFLPIAAGWLLTFFAVWTTKWIREGFKAK